MCVCLCVCVCVCTCVYVCVWGGGEGVRVCLPLSTYLQLLPIAVPLDKCTGVRHEALQHARLLALHWVVLGQLLGEVVLRFLG